jgi:hypothetical protein
MISSPEKHTADPPHAHILGRHLDRHTPDDPSLGARARRHLPEETVVGEAGVRSLDHVDRIEAVHDPGLVRILLFHGEEDEGPQAMSAGATRGRDDVGEAGVSVEAGVARGLLSRPAPVVQEDPGHRGQGADPAPTLLVARPLAPEAGRGAPGIPEIVVPVVLLQKVVRLI